MTCVMPTSKQVCILELRRIDDQELADLENDPMFEDGGSYLDDALSVC